MNFARANSGSSSRFELAAVRLLLCAQAAGAHHQTTPMTRVPVASAQGKVVPFGGEPHHLESLQDDGVGSVAYLVALFVVLTAFLAAALSLATHPLAAVLLALAAMALSVHVVAYFCAEGKAPRFLK
jgi:hypothetical protein